MMQFAFVFVFVFVFSIIPQGYGLNCNVCKAQTGQNPDDCKAPSEITCPMFYDRCLTISATMQMDIGGGNMMTMNTEMRNCSVSMMCNEAAKQQLCQSMNTTGALKKCEYSCCQGNLCNDGVGPQPTFAPSTSGLKPTFALSLSGNGIKCYACQADPRNPNACKTPSQITCPTFYDRCSTISATMQMDIGGGNIMTMNTELRNCSVSMMCNEAAKQQLCQSMNITGALKKCEYSCCQGNLCNTGVGPQPTFAPSTSAKNLSCYECGPEGMGPNGTGEDLISCDKPRERKCGELVPGLPFDRCMTVKMAVKNPQTGAILKQEMRNCSISSFMCQNNMACQNVNSTGGVVSCESTCCTGNLCNTDPPKLTSTPAGPTTGPTTGQTTGQTTGPTTGQATCPTTDQTAGQTTGQTALAISNILAIISLVIAFLFK